MKNQIMKPAAVLTLAITLAAALVSALATAACSGGSNPPASVAVTGVTLSRTSLTLGVGGDETLTAAVAPADATNKGVAWTSSDPAVASVAGSGATVTVSALAIGTATITVTTQDGAKTAECGVTVTPPVAVTGVTLDKQSLPLAAGASGTLTATVAPPDATNKNVTWNNSAPTVVSIAPVAGSGATVTVTALAAGTAFITAFSAADTTKFAACTVTVSSDATVVAGVAVTPTTLSLTAGGFPAGLTATVLPATATNRNVTWANDAPEVATISATTGATISVTPVAVGSANITVTTQEGSKTATCAVTVAPAPVSRLLLPKALAVRSAGGQAKLTADITPFNAANRNVTWTTSNPSVATVAGTGAVATVTGGTTTGTARITATSVGSPAVSDYCDVTVAASLFQEAYMGGEFGMTRNGAYEDAYNGTVYSVTVDSAGVVHASGYHYEGGVFHPTYFRNGARTHLPMSAGMSEGVGAAIHVTHDGHVYIAGLETDGNTERAKLWVDGANSPLAGAADYLMVEATDVFVSGGNVYVTGWQSADGQRYSPAALWINGAKTTFTNLATSAKSVVALGSDVYVGGGFGVIRLNPATPTAYTVIPGYDSGDRAVESLRLVGEDIYAAGWVGNNPAQWKNHARTTLPRDSSSNYAEAYDVSVTQDGAVYVCGAQADYVWAWYLYTPLLWRNGAVQGVGALGTYDGYAYTIFVRESAKVGVTGVTMNASTLNVPVGHTGTLTATVLPATASDKGLAWTSSDPAVASVTGAGATVTINGLALGGPVTITARSLDNPSASATCTVNVVTVAVTDVSLPPTFTVGLNRTARLTASLTPPEATNRNATWSSSNPAVASVEGTGLVAVVSGRALGDATITVTTQDGLKVATCLVTVASVTDPVMYIAGEFGLYIDGAFDTLIGDEPLTDIVTDSAGNVHATGWHHDPASAVPWKAAHYRNGARTLLPMAPGAIEAGGYGIAVTAADQVYIAGYEIVDDDCWTAKLWLDGVSQTLQGTADYDAFGNLYETQALVVRLHDGHVYVGGRSQDAGHDWRGTIWKDGVRHQFQGLSGAFRRLAIDSAGAFYVQFNNSGVYKISPDLSSYQQIQLDGSGNQVFDISVDGADLYVAGWSYSEAYYWKNGGARLLLPRPEGSGSAEADAIYAAGGHFHIAGALGTSAGYGVQTWRDDQMIPLDSAVAIKDIFPGFDEARPNAIFVK